MSNLIHLADLDLKSKEILQTFENERVFFIKGNLGAGKTTLVQSFCKNLGVNQVVQSPSFGLVHEYQSLKGPVFHADLYRLNHFEEIYELGILEFIDSGNYIFIEWPEILLEHFLVTGVELCLENFSENARQFSCKLLK